MRLTHLIAASLVGVVTLLGVTFLVGVVTLQMGFEGAGVALATAAGLAAAVAVVIKLFRFLEAREESRRIAGGPDALASAPAKKDEPLTLASVRAELRAREATTSRAGLWLLASLALFVVVGLGSFDLEVLAVVTGVLLFHELGHWAAMKWFGYRDLKIFFVPWVGALTAGRKENAPGWQRGIVLLMGPLPGMVLGFVLAVSSSGEEGLVPTIATALFLLNAFNLLPLEPLDGGRLVSEVLLPGFPRAQLAIRGVSGLVLIAVGGATKEWGLLGLGGVLMSTLPNRWATLQSARRLRTQLREKIGALPDRPAKADPRTLKRFFKEAKRARRGLEWVGGKSAHPVKETAGFIEATYQLVAAPQVGWGAGLAIGAAYFAAVALPTLLAVQVAAGAP